MHYLLPLSPASLGRFDRGEWGAYLTANKKFSDRLMEIIAPDDDYIWVHDYHLMLLPSFLRKRFNTCRLGFFLHCPFPSSELFRTFPAREALLRALLNCDVIGFHTFDYARHFLSCCSRMLGLAYASQRGMLGIEYYGRKIGIKICPTARACHHAAASRCPIRALTCTFHSTTGHQHAAASARPGGLARGCVASRRACCAVRGQDGACRR